MTKTTLNSLFILLMATQAHAKTTLIHAGQLLAIPGEPPLTEQTGTVVDGRITQVEPGYTQADISSDTEVIDLRDSFVMPGLMDMHVHLQGQLGPDNDRDALKMSSQLVGMRTVHHGKKTLMAGFTTVSDVGSDSQYMYAYRDAVNNGWVDGPRVIAAGGVGITGGHADAAHSRSGAEVAGVARHRAAAAESLSAQPLQHCAA